MTKVASTPAASSSVLKPVNRTLDGAEPKPKAAAHSEEDQAKIQDLTKKVCSFLLPQSEGSNISMQNAELKLAIDSLEKERDFYFGKLREVEVLAQNSEKTGFVEQLLAILYVPLPSFICGFLPSCRYASDDENFAAAGEDEVADA